MKTLYIGLLVTISTSILVPSTASACSCITLTPCEDFGNASAVFIGRMLGGTEKAREEIKNGKTVSYEAGYARFAVEEVFKGFATTTTEVTVFITKNDGWCKGDWIARGHRYLVYAADSDSLGLIVGGCSPTKLIEEAGDDLTFLRNLPFEGTGGRLYGRVAVEMGKIEPTPLAGVTIIAEDESHITRVAKTDGNGNYEFSRLSPAAYIVKPVLPEIYAHSEDREVTVADRGCARAPFWLRINGRIRGRVTDSTGRPAPTDLRLVSVDESKRDSWLFSDTGKDGRYEIHGIPPGSYLLQVQLIKDNDEKSYFYPGTRDKSKAKVIEIDLAQKLDGYDLQLPPELQVKTVQGLVTYSDGRPVSNAVVELAPEESAAYRANRYGRSTKTDELGHFTLSGYKDVIYQITVFDASRNAFEGKDIAGPTELRNLVLKDDISDIFLTLTLERKEEESPESPPRD